jgi:hypothetical protein
MLPFARKLAQMGFPDLTAEAVNTLQVNLGWRCNQACRHCHLAAGPDRPEQMGQAAIDAVIKAVARWSIPVVDLTGGSPEINPHFEYLVHRLAQLDVHLLIRCNLTILLEPDYEHLPEFSRPPGRTGLFPALFSTRPGGSPARSGSISQKSGGLAALEPRGIRPRGFVSESTPDV